MEGVKGGMWGAKREKPGISTLKPGQDGPLQLGMETSGWDLG